MALIVCSLSSIKFLAASIKKNY